MLGLGDNLYQRAVVRELGEVQLITPWPQLYADLPVRCVMPATMLRTQRKNMMRMANDLYVRPRPAQTVRLGYRDASCSLVEQMCQSVGIKRDVLDFSMPPTGAMRTRNIVVRPSTVRREWPAASRNPAPGLLGMVCDALRDEFNIISIADLKDGEEWLSEDPPFAHQTYHRGELVLEDILQLVDGAAGLVGGIGWLLPASIAYHVPMLAIYGGWGLRNNPRLLVDHRADASLLVQAMPDPMCMCDSNRHDCHKGIERNVMEAHIERFKQLARARATGVAA